MSLVIMAVVLAAATSITYAAARGIPKSSDPGTQRIESQEAIARMAIELEQAVVFGASDATGCVFTVVDPDDDDNLIDIAYTWSGVAGEPLYRITLAEKREIISDVSTLSFVYDIGESGLYRFARRVSVEVSRTDSNGTTAHASVRLPLRPEVQ